MFICLVFLFLLACLLHGHTNELYSASSVVALPTWEIFLVYQSFLVPCFAGGMFGCIILFLRFSCPSLYLPLQPGSEFR